MCVTPNLARACVHRPNLGAHASSSMHVERFSSVRAQCYGHSVPACLPCVLTSAWRGIAPPCTPQHASVRRCTSPMPQIPTHQSWRRCVCARACPPTRTCRPRLRPVRSQDVRWCWQPLHRREPRLNAAKRPTLRISLHWPTWHATRVCSSPWHVASLTTVSIRRLSPPAKLGEARGELSSSLPPRATFAYAYIDPRDVRYGGGGVQLRPILVSPYLVEPSAGRQWALRYAGQALKQDCT